MSRALARIIPRMLRNDLWDTPTSRYVTPFGSSWSGMDHYVHREFRNMFNMMNRLQNEMSRHFDGFHSNESPSGSLFRLVEEDGKRKVRVQFHAENMKPEDIYVKTRGNTLEIRAKQEEKGDHHSIYQEYCRQLTLPDGVKPEELSCKFEDGVVTLEAPYTPPAVEAGEHKLEGLKEIPITHEKAEEQGHQQQQRRKEIPVERSAEGEHQGGQERERQRMRM